MDRTKALNIIPPHERKHTLPPVGTFLHIDAFTYKVVHHNERRLSFTATFWNMEEPGEKAMEGKPLIITQGDPRWSGGRS